MKLSELANKNPVTVSGNTTIAEAATLMRERHVGDLIVTDDNDIRKPIGIVTDRDFVVGILAVGLDPKVLTVGDVMSQHLFAAIESDDADQAMAKMRREGIRRAPVVDDEGNLQGIFTLDDYLDHLAGITNTIRGLIRREQAQEERTRLALSHN